MITRKEAALLKLNLLVDGITFSKSFLMRFEQEKSFMEKRRVYNNPDEEGITKNIRIPQELIIDDVVVAVNYKSKSKWVLDYDVDKGYYIREGEKYITEVSFSPKPQFLAMSISNGVECGYVANLYGGKHLAFFTPAYCIYNNFDQGCLFCSLKNNRKMNDDYAYVISESMVREVTRCAIQHDEQIVSGIMLVGGNVSDEDKGFLNFLDLTEAMEKEQLEQKGNVVWETHIATMPPQNELLFKKATNLNVRITMNMEVFDDALFAKYCPGKNKRFGRQKIIDRLKSAANTLDYGRIHSILIAGLEPVESTIEGIHFLASIGVCPIINIFHNDYGTALQNFERPKVEDLLLIGQELQKIYEENDFIPYWNGCGRNSLDYEAKSGLFI